MQAYLIKPEHVGQDYLHQFLYKVIGKEFEGRDYSIVGETPLDRLIPGRDGIRKLIALNVESGVETHAVYFDVTEVQAARSINWLGR